MKSYEIAEIFKFQLKFVLVPQNSRLQVEKLKIRQFLESR